MGDVVDLKGQPAHLENDLEFIADCCRFAENILTEAQVRKKYRLPDDVWEKLGDDDKLVEKIEAEKIRSGRLPISSRLTPIPTPIKKRPIKRLLNGSRSDSIS